MDYRIELEKTLEQMEKVFSKRLSLTETYLNQQISLKEAKNNLEVRKAQGLLSGEIEGKNEALREAVARSLLVTEYTRAEKTERAIEELKVLLETASLEYQFLQDKYRILIALTK